MKYYLVGGACRDILMGKIPHDYDFVVVGAAPEDFRDWECVGKDFPVFLEPTYRWEVSLARIERKVGIGYTGFESSWNDVTLEEDLSRRDLTINSIAIEVDWEATLSLGEPVLVGSWIDLFNGISDIKNKTLRPTTDKFKEDPVRLLRAARFLARYGDFNHSVDLFEMGAQLQNSGELSSLVPDRVWAETQKALTEDYPHKYFMFLQNFKFPFSDFLTDMLNTVENNAYHRESSVFKHTMMVLEEASKHKDPVINFAALMHDMGKYICYYQYGNAHGHDIEGIPLIKDFCNKWKVPNDYRDSAIITCEQHQKVHSCMGRSTNSWSRPKSIMKMFEQSSAINKPERFKKMLLVCEADNVGRLCDDPKEDYKQSSYLSECLDAVISLDTKSISAKMLEDGKNGKLIGEAIRVARINEIRKVQNKWKEIK